MTMTDVAERMKATLKRVENDLMMFMGAGQGDPHCDKWADDLMAEVRAVLKAIKETDHD
jgi:hypothetical protein